MVLVATGSSNASQDTDVGVLWLPGGAGRAVRASKGRGGLRLVQNHFGFLKMSADACLTLCTAGRDTEEEAVHFSGKGSIREALEPLALDRAVEGLLPLRAWGLLAGALPEVTSLWSWYKTCICNWLVDRLSTYTEMVPGLGCVL